MLIVLFAAANSYSQETKDDEGNILKNNSGVPVINTNVDDKPVYKQNEEKKIESKNETFEVKTEKKEDYSDRKREEKKEDYSDRKREEKKEDIDDEMRKKEEEEGIFHETKTENTENAWEVKNKKKKQKKVKKDYKGERGKSESRGNKDKNNDSPYDHDQGRGNDWKINYDYK